MAVENKSEAVHAAREIMDGRVKDYVRVVDKLENEVHESSAKVLEAVKGLDGRFESIESRLDEIERVVSVPKKVDID